MRIPLLVLASLALLATSCRSPLERQLNCIDLWIDARPDSAYVLLGRMDVSGLKRNREKALYALLLSEARDKCYIDESNDSLIRVAFDYYSSRRPDDRAMRSWYYLGVVQRNSGNVSSSIFSFLHSGELALRQKNYKYAGLSERSIAELYYDSYETMKAENHYCRAVECFELSRDTLYADYARLSWAACKSDLREFSSCDSLCGKVAKDNSDNPVLLGKVYEVQAFSSMLRTPPDATKAIDYFRKSCVYSSDYFESPRVSVIAHSFQINGSRDSADYYLNKAFEHSITAVDSAVVFFEMSEIMTLRGDYKDAKRYLEQAVHIQDSLTRVSLTQSVTTVINEQFKQDNTIQRLKAERRLFALILTVEVSAIIVVLLLFVISVTVRKIRLRNHQIKEKENQIARITAEIASYKANLEELTRDIAEARDRSRISADAVSRQITERVMLINELTRQNEKISKRTGAVQSYWDKINYLEDLVEEYGQVMEKIQLKESFFCGLEEDLNASRSDIMKIVRGCYADSFSEDDYRLLMCILIGMKPKNIAFLINMSSGVVRTRKSRLLTRIRENPSSELTIQILSLIEEVG